jgi:hypothetical protein
MHDPRTLVFSSKLVRIWHVDPEKGGDEDSCGWGWPKLSSDEIELAVSLIVNPYDNLRRWFSDVDELEAEGRIMQIFKIHKRLTRPWWKHPQWHFWHWEIQLPLVLHFKRWAFSRCQLCGGRFRWREIPVGYWGNDGPRWFRNAERVSHQRCEAERHKVL